MSKNLFIRDLDYYQRDLDPVRQYIDQASFYLFKVNKIPYNQIREELVKKLKGRQLPGARDPDVHFFERQDYADKELTIKPLSQYLSSIATENLTMAPSMTCYVHASEKLSILSGFTDENVKLRNIAKKEAAKQKALGNKDKAIYYSGEQENKKLYNNAASGAMISGGSIINNPTGHSSLTSTTRTMTSIGNASNERLISGNRHYRNPTITLNNIVVLAQNCDVEEISQTVQKFGLVYPTVDETMKCIQFSSDLYWRDDAQMRKIRRFVECCHDEERASIVYTGDLYHLRLYNESAIRRFLTALSQKVTTMTYDDPIDKIKETDEMYVNYVHQICLSEVRGIGKDYTKLSLETQNTVAGTCKHLESVLDDYQDLIRTFFLTSNLPPSVGYIRDSIRRCVVLSDTDSTMFSCDEWVQWYFGDIRFTDEAFALSGSVMFMATQCIAHSLAIYSANLNVEKKKLLMASMKPEFVASIFSLTSVGKHYYAHLDVKEGSVYKESELELKGVHLKNSASPKILMNDVKQMVEAIMTTVKSGSKVSLTYWIQHVINLENSIRKSVMAGEMTYLGRLNIKSQDAYKEGPDQSNYRHHVFWNETFGPTYGLAPPPTYSAVKFPSTLSSKRHLQNWIEGMKDESLKERMRAYFLRTGRENLNTIYVSQEHVSGYGIPPEVIQVIDIESLILQHMGAHRLVLGTLGYFPKHDLNLSQEILIP